MSEHTPLPGRHDRLVSEALEAAINGLGGDRVELRAVEDSELPHRLAGHLGQVLEQELLSLRDRSAQLRLARTVVAAVSAQRQAPVPPGRVLELVREAVEDDVQPPDPAAPLIPLSSHDLLVHAHGEPTLGSVLQSEIASADGLDLIVAFVTWHGVRLVVDEIARAVRRGCRVRLLTTTYTGITSRTALDRLVEAGVEVKVSYDTATTRLHAKTWIVHRQTGFSTALIGSSNLTRTALLDGREWNVRVSRASSPTLFDKLGAAFEANWQASDFETYVPERDQERLDLALADAAGGRRDQSEEQADAAIRAGIQLRPWPYQEEILEALDAERQVHGRWRNLVVAPTGTGKTVVAAIDYRRLRRQLGRDLTLLFVAHREQILRQSRATFRVALGDPSFGELLVGGVRPTEHRHVFASVQSLHATDPTAWSPDRFDVLVVDEFHHSEAPTYRRFLDHFEPATLLALTATPERADGLDIRTWTGGRTAFDMRLWHALDRQLLAPFQYFGIADETIDYQRVDFRRGRYDIRQLGEVFTGDEARARLVLTQTQRIVGEPRQMRALGFCATVEHAHYMAEIFCRAGWPAVALDGTSPQADRDQAVLRLRDGDLCTIFTRDIFNEGVDIPSVDTILLLRPTESVTVHLQQVGRGLRRHPDKDVCTVLDFVGQHRREYRYDLRLRQLTGLSRQGLIAAAEEGFPYLPTGCHLELDRQATEWVLDHLRAAVASGKRALRDELRLQATQRSDGGAGITLGEFIEEAGVEPEDVGRGKNWGWATLRRETDLETRPAGEAEKRLQRGVTRYHHADDLPRISQLRAWLSATSPPDPSMLSLAKRRLLWGYLVSLYGVRYAPDTMEKALEGLWGSPAVLDEARQLLAVLHDRIGRVSHPAPLSEVPARIGATYSRDELLSHLGGLEPGVRVEHQAGPWWSEDLRTAVLFITLHKSEERYSPETRYRDYAISRTRFHWESPHTTARDSERAARWIGPEAADNTILLAVRERPTDVWGATAPYVLLGPARLVAHEGERPISITWELEHPIPAELYPDFVAAVA